ncbi:hypothetical protein D3C85_1386810 [compost metagenome]
MQAIMATMHALRTSSILARLVLAWFALTMGVAMASPIVAPKTMEMICSGSGLMQLIEMNQDGEVVPAGQHTLDCAMCLPVFLPSSSMTAQVSQPQPLAHALTPMQAAHIAALVGAPLPPRGPPALS